MKELLSRGITTYHSGGIKALKKGVGSFIGSGEARYKFLGVVPYTQNIIRLYTQLGHQIFPNGYTDADPFKILWIDPSRITKSTDVTQEQLRRFGRVRGGNWDQKVNTIEEDVVYQSFKKRFQKNLPWKETKYYTNMQSRIENNEHTRAGYSISDLNDYFTEFDELYTKIELDGYQTQQFLEASDPETTRMKNMDAPVPQMNEIGVCIGRSGQLIHSYRGKHRLMISKLADVDSIAVQVLTRHREWQSVRDQLRNEGIQNEHSKLNTHPDLEDILN